MARQLLINVPDTVTSHFVVATDDPPRDPYPLVREYVAHHLPEPLSRVASDLLGTPLLEIRTDRTSDFAADIASAPKPDLALARRLERTTHHLVITSHAPPLAQPEHAQAARAVARGLATRSDGIVFDVRGGRFLSPRFHDSPEPATFRLADQWLPVGMTADVPEERLRYDVCDALGTPRTAPSVRLETAGLHRFGLPDLVLSGAPPAGWWRPLNLLRGLAVRLLTEHWDWLRRHPGSARRQTGNQLWVDAHDVWSYWARGPGFGTHGRVRVRLVRAPDECPGAPPLLKVMPPRGFSGSRQDWLNSIASGNMYASVT